MTRSPCGVENAFMWRMDVKSIFNILKCCEAEEGWEENEEAAAVK